MIEERLRRSVVEGPGAHEDSVAWRIVAFLTWWRTWVGTAVMLAGYLGSLAFAPSFGAFALPVIWMGGFVTHAVASPVIDV